MGYKDEILVIKKTFISLNELLSLLAKCEDASTTEMAHWLMTKDSALDRSLILELDKTNPSIVKKTSRLNSRFVDPYTQELHDAVDISPLKVACQIIKEWLEDNTNDDFNYIGFARKNILLSLNDLEANIPEIETLEALSYDFSYDEPELMSIEDVYFLTQEITDLKQENEELKKNSKELPLAVQYNKNISSSGQTIIDQQQATIDQLKARIAELESQQQTYNNPDQFDLFTEITNPEHNHYAPDLCYAVKLWHSVYIQNPKKDSHNNKANTWIKNNTPYSGEQEDTATRRIREISAPLNDWHISRKNHSTTIN